MLRRLTRCLIAGSILAIWQDAWANPDAVTPCQQTPTAHCLIRNAIAQWPQIPADDPDRLTLATQLAFEARQFQLSVSDSIKATARPEQLPQSLEQEEDFLHSIRRQETERARLLMKTLPAPLQDYLHSPPQALLLEALTLELQDHEADTFKRSYYETLLNLDADIRTQRMIAVARHEILGGQPEKGRRTLDNTDIDEFSAAHYYQARKVTEWLALGSTQVFLQPDHAMGNCDTPDRIADAIQYHLHNEVFLLVTTSSELSSDATRTEAMLLLARLHHNSAQCSLLTTWLTHHAVFLSQKSTSMTATTLLQDVMLARAIRRYLF